MSEQSACVTVTNEAEALTAARSDDWSVRKSAGTWLALHPRPAHREVLIDLLIDAQDTAVGMGTASAIVENPTELSLSIMFTALASADVETLEHLLFAIAPLVLNPLPSVELKRALDRCAEAGLEIAAAHPVIGRGQSGDGRNAGDRRQSAATGASDGRAHIVPSNTTRRVRSPV